MSAHYKSIKGLGTWEGEELFKLRDSDGFRTNRYTGHELV